MSRTHAAFLRGISNVPMQPFRDSLEQIGLTEVGSYGGTGNMFFDASGIEPEGLEALIGDAVGAEAFVRSREELAAIVAGDPNTGRGGAGVFIAKGPISEDQAASLLASGFEGVPPVISGAVVYFVHPTLRPGRKTVVDFERALSVRGTMRGSTVVARVLNAM